MQTKIGKWTVVDRLNHFEMWIVNVEMLDNIIEKQNDEKNVYLIIYHFTISIQLKHLGFS